MYSNALRLLWSHRHTQKFEVGAFIIEVLFRCENEQKLEAISGVSLKQEIRRNPHSKAFMVNVIFYKLRP